MPWLVTVGGYFLLIFGKEINEYNIVVRFNSSSNQRIRRNFGNKTTFRVLNALWTNIYAKNVQLKKDGSLDSRGNIRLGEIKSIPLEMDATLIISRTSVENFSFSVQPYRKSVRTFDFCYLPQRL